MGLVQIRPDDVAQVTAVVDLLNTGHQVDDPDAFSEQPAMLAAWLRYGWDLDPPECHLYTLPGDTEPVGVVQLDVPHRDNRHLMVAEISVHPRHRRRGHGTTIMTEVLDRARRIGRSTVWAGTAEDDPGGRAFLEHLGFRYASHDARRRQRLAEVDPAEVDRLADRARSAAADYDLVRLQPPTAAEVLTELSTVVAAINDAPMGELTVEDEVFDRQRLQDQETATARRGAKLYRVIARHRETDVIGGHTMVALNPQQPGIAHQGDTAVARAHRGHRLGLALKIDMMRWLAEVEPQLEVVETWNHADNGFMIDINEALGYRLSRVFATYERALPGNHQT